PFEDEDLSWEEGETPPSYPPNTFTAISSCFRLGKCECPNPLSNEFCNTCSRGFPSFCSYSNVTDLCQKCNEIETVSGTCTWVCEGSYEDGDDPMEGFCWVLEGNTCGEEAECRQPDCPGIYFEQREYTTCYREECECPYPLSEKFCNECSEGFSDSCPYNEEETEGLCAKCGEMAQGEGTCDWNWGGSYWTLENSGCSLGYDCAMPNCPGYSSNETATTNCFEGESEEIGCECPYLASEEFCNMCDEGFPDSCSYSSEGVNNACEWCALEKEEGEGSCSWSWQEFYYGVFFWDLTGDTCDQSLGYECANPSCPGSSLENISVTGCLKIKEEEKEELGCECPFLGSEEFCNMCDEGFPDSCPYTQEEAQNECITNCNLEKIVGTGGCSWKWQEWDLSWALIDDTCDLTSGFNCDKPGCPGSSSSAATSTDCVRYESGSGGYCDPNDIGCYDFPRPDDVLPPSSSNDKYFSSLSAFFALIMTNLYILSKNKKSFKKNLLEKIKKIYQK
ncbi:MAG: hypothetical protein PHQ08_03320, partial [Candidatus Pacebacteria bacterium]|nr:hypothetical protein [Candidatus Paceibacterota bacterium]